MARRPRRDQPESWHHVVHRALAKRPYFETRSDKRYFLAQIAHEVRAGRLELHAFSLMTTHFHLLVRSPVGESSNSMRRIQNAYSRYFNRRRKRDDPLIRARYFSRGSTPTRNDARSRALELTGAATLDGETNSRAVASHARERGDWIVERGGRDWRRCVLAKAGLLRDLSAESFESIGRQLGLGVSAAARRVHLHRELLQSDSDYAGRLAEMARAAINEVGLAEGR